MKKATMKVLQAQAEETKYPPRFPQGEEPQELVAWFIRRRVVNTTYGDWTLYQVVREDGVVVELNGSHRLLRRKMDALNPEAYDLVYVQYEGRGKVGRKGKPPHLYSLAVLARGDEGHEIPDNVDEIITAALAEEEGDE